MRLFGKAGEVAVLPARELVMADVAGVSRGYEQARLAALDASAGGACFAVASVQAAALRTHAARRCSRRASVTHAGTGQEAPLDESGARS